MCEPKIAPLLIHLSNDEKAIQLAEKMAHKLGRQVRVLDAGLRELWVADPERKLDS